MQKHPQSTKICDVFLQQTVFLRLCVTQITKIAAKNLLQSPQYAKMGSLYWGIRVCLFNFYKERVHDKV